MKPTLSTNSLQTLLEKASTEVSFNRIPTAIQTLFKALTLFPDSPEISLKLAHCYLLSNNFPFSFALYTKVSQEGTPPQKREAFYGLAELNYSLKNFLPAEYFFQLVLTNGKDFEMLSSVYLKLGIIYKKLGNYPKALTYLNACTQLHDLLPEQLNELLLQLGSTFEMIENRKQAAEMYVEAAKLKKNARNLVCLAWIFIKTNKFEKAESLLMKAARMVQIGTKEHCDIQFVLAAAYLRSRKMKEAEKILEELIQNYPNEPFYCAAFAILLNAVGKEGAVGFMCRAVAVMPERVDFQKVLMGLQEKKEESVDCVEVLRIDITEFPFNHALGNFVNCAGGNGTQGSRRGFCPVQYL